MVQGEREIGPHNEPDPIREAFENSSLVKTVALLETTKIPQPSFQSLNVVLPPGYERQRINYAIREVAALELVMRDPEYCSLWQALIEEPKKPGGKFRENRPTEEAMFIYAEFLASNAPIIGRITAAAPVFRDYMRKTAKYENLGPFFRRIIEELRKGDPEIAAFLIVSEHHLEVFHQLDYTHGWVQDRLKMSGGESWTRFHADTEKDPKKREQLIGFYAGDLDHKESLVKSSSKFRKFTTKVLDIYFDSNDSSNWRKFIRLYFPTVMTGFRYFDPENYDPEKQYQRLQSLFEAVPNEDWDFLAGYFIWTEFSRSKRAVEVLEPQVLKGDLENARAFVEFNHIIESQDPENLSYADESKAITYWLDRFAEGNIAGGELVDIANSWIARRKALFSHREPYRAELGFAAVSFLTDPETYKNGDLVAQLTHAGVNPEPGIKQKVKESGADIEALRDFGRTISELVRGDFRSEMLPVVNTWAHRYLNGEIGPEGLKRLVSSIRRIKAAEDRIAKNKEISDEEKEYFKQFTRSLYVTERLGEIDDPESLINPEGITGLIMQNVFPTPRILKHIATNGAGSVNQLLEALKETQEGHFEPNSELHRELQFARYLKMFGADDIAAQYERFQKLPYVEKPEPPRTLSETDVREAEFTALEAARVYWLIKERVDAGRNVLVIANERYGKLFVADPLAEELVSLAVRVDSTYVRSGAAMGGTVEKIFDEETEQYIRQELPDVFVVDGTATPLASGNKDPRFSRAMIAFDKWFRESDLGYHVAFWTFFESSDAQLGEVNVPFRRPGYDGPQAIIVNSTVSPDHIKQLSEKLKGHSPGYFDDYEGNLGRGQNNIVLSKTGLTQLPRMSEKRYLSAVQRTIKEAIPGMIMSPDSDPHI